MRSPGRRAAPRHRAPSVAARGRAETARGLRGADGGPPSGDPPSGQGPGGREPDRSTRTATAGRAPPGRPRAGRFAGWTVPRWTGPGRAGTGQRRRGRRRPGRAGCGRAGRGSARRCAGWWSPRRSPPVSAWSWRPSWPPTCPGPCCTSAPPYRATSAQRGTATSSNRTAARWPRPVPACTSRPAYRPGPARPPGSSPEARRPLSGAAARRSPLPGVVAQHPVPAGRAVARRLRRPDHDQRAQRHGNPRMEPGLRLPRGADRRRPGRALGAGQHGCGGRPRGQLARLGSGPRLPRSGCG